MSRYSIGSVVHLSTTITDRNGTAGDAAAVTVNIQKPDLTIDGPFTPTHDGVGLYSYDYTPATAGHYVARWVSTGTNAGAFETEFDVRGAYTTAGLVSLFDVKAALTYSQANLDDDDILQRLIEVATVLVEDIAGPVLPRIVAEDHDGGGSVICLRQQPVISITSVVESVVATPYTLVECEPGTTSSSFYSYSVELGPGLVYARTSTSLGRMFYPGQQNVKVTYQAGRATVPANIAEGALRLIKHLQSSYQGYAATLGVPMDQLGGAGAPPLPPGFVVPNEVRELLLNDPSRRKGYGVA